MNIPPFHDNSATIMNTSLIICCCLIISVSTPFICDFLYYISEKYTENKIENKLIKATTQNILVYSDSIAMANPKEFYTTKQVTEKDSVHYAKKIKKHLKSNKAKYIKRQHISETTTRFSVNGKALIDDKQLLDDVVNYRKAVSHLAFKRKQK